MNRKMSKRQKDIKSKLMAAISMLLVSSIMMVSSTYAWFTLSTAPEVTGISTSVGANGNLEMALLPTSGATIDIESNVGDSVKNDIERNTTWGNLVDLSDASYGLDQIAMYPAALNTGDDGKLQTAMLKFPSYGADGRIAELQGNTFTGVYNTSTSSFSPDSSYGVRAVGSASGMTDRQLSYRNARGAADSAKSYAAKLAADSLDSNGDALAGIAIKKGTDGNAAKFTDTDVDALRGIVSDLTEENGVLDQIDTAYMQYVLALAASAATGTEDLAWRYVKGLVEADGATIASVVAAINGSEKPAEFTGVSITLPTELTEGIAAYETARRAVDNEDADTVTDGDTRGAKQLLAALSKTDGNDYYTWTQISPILYKLANPDAMTINNIPAGEVGDKLGDLVSSVAKDGINVVMGQNGGIYADIADQTMNFTADVEIKDLVYNGTNMGDFPAKMKTNGKDPSYLKALGTVVETAGAPAGGDAGSVPITDMYGYVIDMAFRTNAASSNLVLQTQAADRIYTSNNASGGAEVNGETTMGNGANMTFYSVNPSFSNDSVVNLMKAIRVVFFDPDSGEIVKYALLDLGTEQDKHYTTTADGGIKADLKLYTYSATDSMSFFDDTWTDTDTGITYRVFYTTAKMDVPFCRSYTETVTSGEDPDVTTTTVTKWQTYTPGADGTEGTWGTASETEPQDIPYKVNSAGFAPATDSTIMALTQNTAHKLSVLVYLDGEQITNKDVASNGTKSVTGTLNLQFSSDANLTPMDYTPLMNTTGTAVPDDNDTDFTNVTVNSATADISAAGSFDADGNATITVTGLATGETISEVSVGGTKVEGATISGNTVTFTQTGLTASSAIVVKTSTGT